MNQNANAVQNRAEVPRVVVVGLASCFGCQLQITNVEAHLMEVLGQIDLQYWQLASSEPMPEEFDVAVIEGAVTTEESERLVQRLREKASVVIAIGACACTGGVFQDCYNVVGGVDHVIPVDVYVPGCAAKPEAIIDGVVLALEVVKGKLGLRDMPQTTIFE